MRYLIIVSVIWAFSFGLIKTYLTGLDPFVVSGVRLFVALLVFLPFLRLRTVDRVLSIQFLAIGAVQFGVMYGTYIYTFQYMEAHKIALFTVTTPLMVTLLNDLLEKQFRVSFLLCSAVSVFGAVVIYYNTIDLTGTLIGIFLLQASNLCFAAGQVLYRRLLLSNTHLRSQDHFAWLYLGGVVATLGLMAFGSDLSSVSFSGSQIAVILLLGVVASGLGFFLWNYGATLTNAGNLAVMNNLKIPLAVAVSLLFFEDVTRQQLLRLVIGGGIIVGAVYLNDFLSSRRKTEPV